MKLAYWPIVILLLTMGCKKNDSPNADQDPNTDQGKGTDSTNANQGKGTNTLHVNVTIHETIKTEELKQQALGLFQLQDPKKILFTASRSYWEAQGKGFRIGSITKDSGCNWVRSYFLSDSYRYQFANCSVFDKNQYAWVAGNVAGAPYDYLHPYITKLNTNGDIEWSKHVLISTQPAGRSIALLVLKNGDLAFLTNTMNDLRLYRISPDGTILWAKTITHNFTLTLLGYINYNNGNQTLAESPDGSIYMALSSKGAPDSKEVLIKLSSSGSLLFAKSYSYLPSVNFMQPHIVCLNDGRITYGDNMNVTKYNPCFFVIASDGSLQAAMGIPQSSPISNTLFISELQYHNNNVYLTTNSDYQVNMYKTDASLNTLSSVKTLNTDISLYGVGLSLFDADSSRWHHMLNFTGGTNTGNGFQYMTTKEDGTSCHSYPEGPEKLSLQSISVTTKNETGVTIKDDAIPTYQNLNWETAPVPISGQANACAK